MKQRFCPRAVFPICLLAGLAASLGSAQPTKGSEQAGALLFRDKGCAYCHGPRAQGTEHGPSLATVRKRLSADQMRHQITHGGQKMPPFGDILTEDQIAQVISFLRAKHPSFAPASPDSPPLSNPVQ